jgi:predicted RNA methylase
LIPGVFYTPDAAADTLVEGAIALWLSERTGRSFEHAMAAVSGRSPWAYRLLSGRTLLDPSCGGGALFAAALRALPGLSAKMVGGDIDPCAIRLCHERFGDRVELYQGDARTPGPEGDLVLTNPPYGKDPSSADIDRYVTFWGAAARRVKPDGVLAVLAPRSWRTGVRYAAARRDVIERTGVRRVVDLPRGSFPDAYVDTCVALCVPGPLARPPSSQRTLIPAVSSGERAGNSTSTSRLGLLFLARRGILAPSRQGKGTPLLLGPIAPFVWPTHPSAFSRVRPRDVVEGKAALSLDRGPRLLVRRIVGRASRLTCLVALRPALVKKDFYVLAPRDPSLSLRAYAALLHSRLVAERLAEADEPTTKEDFAQLTLTRLRDLCLPRLLKSTPRDQRAVRRSDAKGVASEPRLAAAWLEAWERQAEALGRRLTRERARKVDHDPRWAPLRDRLDAFVVRMGWGP